MPSKFWMLKGSIGVPVYQYPSRESAELRARDIASESGNPCYVLEAVAVCTPIKPPPPVVVWEKL